MANSRAIKNRIKTVKNTGKITKTMAMVSTAKSTRAVGTIKASRPYQQKLAGILGAVGVEQGAHPLLKTNEAAERSLVIMVTANRGLCGGYNTNIVKRVLTDYDESHDVIAIGKKGNSVLRFNKIPVLEAISDVPDIATFESSSSISQKAIDAFLAGQYKEVKVVYTKFFSAGRQAAVTETFLPLPLDMEGQEQQEDKGLSDVEPIFEPGKEELLEALIPKIARISFYRMLLDSSASEHIARQIAMNNASDNANDMVRSLTLSYNRARQAQITTELAEIVGGAEALN